MRSLKLVENQVLSSIDVLVPISFLFLSLLIISLGCAMFKLNTFIIVLFTLFWKNVF